MGGAVRTVIVLSAIAGCAAEAEPPVVQVAGETLTLASSIRLDSTSVAVLNVERDACAAFYDGVDSGRIDGEPPMLLGAFAGGAFGVLAIDGDDPRTYVTARTGAANRVDIDSDVVDIRLEFDVVIRQIRVGLDYDIEELPVDEPFVVEHTFVAERCR
jgi:hypothetical protein